MKLITGTIETCAVWREWENIINSRFKFYFIFRPLPITVQVFILTQFYV